MRAKHASFSQLERELFREVGYDVAANFAPRESPKDGGGNAGRAYHAHGLSVAGAMRAER
jgi:hypothetical protein